MKNREERKADDSDTTALRAEWSANARAAYTCACTPTARCLQCCENRWVTLATHFRSSAAELMRVLKRRRRRRRYNRGTMLRNVRAAVRKSASNVEEARKQKEAERSSRLNRTLFEDCRSARCAIHQKRCLRLEIPNVNQAYIKNPGVVPLQEMTIGQLLETAAERYPNRHSVISVHQNQRLTFSQLLQRADRIAAGFKRIGLKKGDRIGIWGPNDYQWLLAYMASSRAGLVIAGLNPMYQFGELDYCLNKIGARAVVAPESYRSQNYADMLLAAKKTSPRLDHVVIYGGAHVAGTRRLDDIENLPSRIEVEAVREEQADISPWSGTNIQFTSGTTGVSKATLLAHRSLVNNSAQGMRRLQLDGDKICMNVPFFHAFGMVMAVSGHLHTGTTIVLESPTFNPAKSVEAVMREKCSVVFGTPTMWTNMIDVQTRAGARIDSVRTGVTGGAPASPELFKRIREHFAFDRLTTAFGLTETTALVNQTLPGEPTELTDTTVGFISDHVEIKLAGDGRRGRHRPVRPGRRAAGAGLQRDARLLGRRGGHRADDHGGRLAAERRSIRAARGRLRPDSRPDQGHADTRRREHLPQGDRVLPREPPGGPRGARVRRPRRRLRRGNLRVRSAARRRPAHGRRAAPLLRRQDRQVQDPALHPLQRAVPQDGQR
ncbi:medium-chain acyl-CoA ligase ACSF2, mitochondrial isoform X4 [Phymastichus coffea]|uniref:medium-chain acyl-CoA ligase ACSF2, mitochondrial isoform X4 n=1 Tax=Phymastichus coffea TaxID=108790 RepID=UPI00273B9BC7|nr:medium-chain acyl-CoA ligase ACSF2, mitochondrial isoform X4 [Phymastichus coffea]